MFWLDVVLWLERKMVVVMIGGVFGSGFMGFFFGSSVILIGFGVLIFSVSILGSNILGVSGFFVIKLFGVFIIILILSILFG